MSQDLRYLASHFPFGENWAAYTNKVSAIEIAEAEKSLLRLLGGERLDSQHFLDIGSGSGLHSLAALRLGAREVVAIDIDPISAATTRALLERYAPTGVWRVENASVFELNPGAWGTFDVVYSWGVLHHTGDLLNALRSAAAMVSIGGRFVFALYRRTWLDWFWQREKRWYASASSETQRRARAVYAVLLRFRLWATGRSFRRYVDEYRTKRGMDFYHDVHDWMGGWPYESIEPDEVDMLMHKLGFASVAIFAHNGRFLGRSLGVLGSGCSEYVYRRV
ncbi:MAG: SAM-dependent methyltransferase [Candidatus Roseilinea sp.]|nr:MAG: SAM-dependent methyltransferase [Candidatus Roseilinea sp.]